VITCAAAGYPSTSVDLTPAEQKAYEAARSQALKDLGINDYAAQPDFASNPTVYRKDLAASQIADSISSDAMDQRIQANAARVSGRGSNHSSNLWPQPAVTDQGGGAGFHQKDIVEVYLWQQVKDGKMALPDAQQAVVSNWRDVYNGLTPAQRTAIAKSLSGMSPEEQAMVTN
jgi:hypothetical protein